MYKNKNVNYVTLFMFMLWVGMVTFQSLTATQPKVIH